MRRYSFRSKDLESLASQLSEIGCEVSEIVKGRITYGGGIELKKYLKVSGDNIDCKLYPTKAYATLMPGRRELSKRDEELLGIIKGEYTFPVPVASLLPYGIGAGAWVGIVLRLGWVSVESLPAYLAVQGIIWAGIFLLLERVFDL